MRVPNANEWVAGTVKKYPEAGVLYVHFDGEVNSTFIPFSCLSKPQEGQRIEIMQCAYGSHGAVTTWRPLEEKPLESPVCEPRSEFSLLLDIKNLLLDIRAGRTTNNPNNAYKP